MVFIVPLNLIELISRTLFISLYSVKDLNWTENELKMLLIKQMDNFGMQMNKWLNCHWLQEIQQITWFERLDFVGQVANRVRVDSTYNPVTSFLPLKSKNLELRVSFSSNEYPAHAVLFSYLIPAVRTRLNFKINDSRPRTFLELITSQFGGKR